MSDLYMKLQTELKTLGLYTGTPDGSWGPLSHGAFLNARRMAVASSGSMSPLLLKYARSTAWSARVSPEFVTKAVDYSTKLAMANADDLMSCMAFETGETFSPTIKNGAGAPYYGLIQFGEAAAKDAGTSTMALLKMTAEQQLDYVYAFFKPYAGKLKTTSDIYMRILWPAAVGKSEDYVLFKESDTKSKAYIQNKGLDIDRNGVITKAEAASKVAQKLVTGLNPINLRVV